jgi:hypothetical protein
MGEQMTRAVVLTGMVVAVLIASRPSTPERPIPVHTTTETTTSLSRTTAAATDRQTMATRPVPRTEPESTWPKDQVIDTECTPHGPVNITPDTPSAHKEAARMCAHMDAEFTAHNIPWTQKQR